MKLFAAAPLALAVLAPSVSSLDVSAVSIGHICGAEQTYVAQKGPRRIEFLPGIGTGGFTVRTTSPKAQRWFDYGIQLYHAFYHEDARLAFDKAVAADAGCAMCLWGQALSRGPTMNFDIEPADAKAGLGMARKALKAAATDEERALAQAMIDRYQGDQHAPATEQKFAAALLAAVDKDPAATDVRLIAAHALMTAGRRTGGEGNQAMGVQARTIILPILKAQPDSTAAIHYYIHATEFAGDPADAAPYAERLAALAPGASHLIHMASHTYIHIGRYEEVAALNARALEVDAEHARATDAPGALGSPDYYPHNLSFGMAGAEMAGDGALAVKFADDARVAFPPGAHGDMSYLFARVMSAYGRYAPDRALKMPEPKASDAMGVVMWRYARGEALAGRGDDKAVLAESQGIAQVLASRDAARIGKFDQDQANIALRVLQGRAEMLEGRAADAAKTFAAAAQLQADAKWDMDPPPWWYPVRRSVAAADLEAGDDAGAVREADESLKAWPGDALALHVRALAEQKLGQAARSEADAAAARAAWHGDPAGMAIDLI